jgi:RecG-like helicase
VLQARQQMRSVPGEGTREERVLAEESAVAAEHEQPSTRRTPTPRASATSVVTPIAELSSPGKYTVEGRIRVVEIRPVQQNSVLACEVSDGTGQLSVLFYGRSHIPGVVAGARLRLTGRVGMHGQGHPAMTNPAYELLFPAVD